MVPAAARELWRTLAGDASALHPGTVRLVRGSRGIAPPGWTGVVRLGDAYVIECGEADAATLETLRSLADPSDPDQVEPALEPSQLLGPGELFYLRDGTDVIVPEVAGEPSEESIDAIRSWLDALPAEDVDESSVGDMERVLVLRRAGQVVGAAGHLTWPTKVGHLGVLVAHGARGTGVGTWLGMAATRRALDLGLTPQWRAAAWNQPSRAVADRIGYVHVGRQMSFVPRRGTLATGGGTRR